MSLQYLVLQHNPDLSAVQLLLGSMTEMQRDLALKAAQDLGENDKWGRHEDIKDHFPRQDPHWDPDTTGGRDRLLS